MEVEKLMSLEEVVLATGLDVKTIELLIEHGEFPRPVVMPETESGWN